jgi:hypothetical protein
MTKLDGFVGFCETFANLNIGPDSPSFSSRKNYFCLPTFAASVSVRDTVCASQVFVDFARGFREKSKTTNAKVVAETPHKSKKNKKRGRGKPTPTYGGVNYGSISEAALGILLEVLIPGFSVKEGHTFQLPLGQGRSVDFLIENTLVEFHFPRSYSRGKDIGDFKDHKERRTFLKSLSRVGRNRHQRKKLLRATHELLIRNYTAKRRRQIDMSVYGPHTELIVASTPEEFYWKVICRFVGLDVISESNFVERFNQCCRSVITCSREAWKEAA